MKLAIVGQDTLAATARQCCAKHFTVLDHTDKNIEVLWVCYDTPLDDRGEPDCEWVRARMRRDIFELRSRPVILISSQMPVGTCAKFEAEFPGHTFACSPENIRVAHAVDDFLNQSRVVVGMRSRGHQFLFEELFFPFTKRVIFTDPETAEMVKHALNCFLALQICYINEIGCICREVRADVTALSDALLSERRISPKAPLRAGEPFGGGHLMRDILTLEEIARGRAISIPLIAHIRESNGDKNHE